MIYGDASVDFDGNNGSGIACVFCDYSWSYLHCKGKVNMFEVGQLVRLKTTNNTIVEGILEGFNNTKYPLKLRIPTIDGFTSTLLFTKDGQGNVGKSKVVLELVTPKEQLTFKNLRVYFKKLNAFL